MTWAALALGHHTKAELIDSVLKVVEEASADKSDKTVEVLIALLFNFSDFILDKPTQFGMRWKRSIVKPDEINVVNADGMEPSTYGGCRTCNEADAEGGSIGIPSS